MKPDTIKIIILFFIIGVSFLSFTLFVNHSSDLALKETKTSQLAAATQYVPITQDDEFRDVLNSVATEDASGDKGLGGVLNMIFIWGIRLVIALSIVFVVFGAVQYMTTDAVFNKKEGKEKIQAAIGGLILALVSWLILYTINPDILSGGFLSKLGNLDPTPTEGVDGVAAGEASEGASEDTGETENPTETPDE